MGRILICLFLLPWALFSLLIAVGLVSADRDLWPVALLFAGCAMLLFRAMRTLWREERAFQLSRTQSEFLPG